MSVYVTFLTALGWSLLDSIWQMALLWTVYCLLTVGNKRISAAGKHNLVLLFVFIGAEWFVYSFLQWVREPAGLFDPGFIPLSPIAGRWIPYLSVIYLLILITRFFQQGLNHYDRLKNQYGQPVSAFFQSFAERHARLMGIPRKVQVFVSDMAETAETSGFFKPLILLPVSLITRLTPQQVEAIIIHELFHIRRNDYLINICMSCFRSIFFFNPFAHLFYKALARERELACDDGVLEKGFEPALYAEALFNLEKLRQPQSGFTMAIDGHSPWLLMERIRRLLGEPSLKKNRIHSRTLYCLFMALMLFSIQQKNPIPDPVTKSLPKPLAVIPARYEWIQVLPPPSPGANILKSSPARLKQLKKRTEPAPVQFVDVEPAEESNPVEQAVFAENITEQNFSNDQSAALSQNPVHESPGTPWVPSASLSYEPRPVAIVEDSLHNILIQDCLRETVILKRIKLVAELKVLEKEIEKNRKLVNEVEIQNREHDKRT